MISEFTSNIYCDFSTIWSLWFCLLSSRIKKNHQLKLLKLKIRAFCGIFRGLQSSFPETVQPKYIWLKFFATFITQFLKRCRQSESVYFSVTNFVCPSKQVYWGKTSLLRFGVFSQRYLKKSYLLLSDRSGFVWQPICIGESRRDKLWQIENSVSRRVM